MSHPVSKRLRMSHNVFECLTMSQNVIECLNMSHILIEDFIYDFFASNPVQLYMVQLYCFSFVNRQELLGNLIGFGIMTYGENTANLDLLAVRPNYRRRGVATRLLRWRPRGTIRSLLPLPITFTRPSWRSASPRESPTSSEIRIPVP